MSLALRHANALLREGRPLPIFGRLATATEAAAIQAPTNPAFADMPLFRLSTPGEATDGNIVLPYWDLSRADTCGIPVIWAHDQDEMHLGFWRDLQVVGQDLYGRCDLDPEDEFARQCLSKIKRDYIRGVSIGWMPGVMIRRSELPITSPYYRAPTEDECGMPGEGYAMGSPESPNTLMEASLCSVPAQAEAIAVQRAMAGAGRASGAILRNEAPSPGDLDKLLASMAGDPRVRKWALGLVRSDPALSAWIRSEALAAVRSVPSIPAEPTLESMFGGLRG